ncbi:hypothetical protein [Nonlabens marinus]|nr:hypothetical protein [Nonlabens marinus]
MKYIIFTLLITGQLAFAQQKQAKPEIIVVTGSTVNTGIPTGAALQEMLESEQLIYVTVGNMTGQLSAYDEFFRSHLYSNYGIGYKFFGCSLMGPELAFMNAMNRKIKKEFGEDFISKEKALARIEFEKQS